MGRGHYAVIKRSQDFRPNINTMGSYIKLNLQCPDPHFRLHWYWPHYSYLNLEKYRNHQNRIRLLRQFETNNENCPTLVDLITKSIYSDNYIIDEIKTTTIPSFI